MLLLDAACQFAEEDRLADTGHVLQAEFFCTGGNLLVGQLAVVFDGVDRGGGDAERTLRCHAALLRPLQCRGDVADVVQTVEKTGDVHALRVLHTVHHRTHVVRNRIHTEGIQTAVEHMGLDAGLVQDPGVGTDGLVGILTGEEVHLLEGAAVCFYTCETAHLDEDRRNTYQLILAWLELAGALPHVSVNETELNFLSHI